LHQCQHFEQTLIYAAAAVDNGGGGGGDGDVVT